MLYSRLGVESVGQGMRGSLEPSSGAQLCTGHSGERALAHSKQASRWTKAIAASKPAWPRHLTQGKTWIAYWLPDKGFQPLKLRKNWVPHRRELRQNLWPWPRPFHLTSHSRAALWEDRQFWSPCRSPDPGSE